MTPKQIKMLVIAVIVVVAGLAIVFGCFKHNDDQNWQIVQSIGGKISVRDQGGWYPTAFATVWTYPRYADFRYNDDPDEGDDVDERIRVTFNDGGTAQISTFVRIQTPITEADRKEFHRQFGGEMANVKAATKAHLTNSLKSTAPLMSSSEHQSARKAEFANHTENQMRLGLYEMRKVEKELKDRTDEEGNPITVFATEIVTDTDGKSVVAQESPLTTKFMIAIDQFSVTGTDYDPEILQQFAAKKKSFLMAEQSKAAREEMVQERLKIEEEGLKDKAQAEAKANVEKATAVIQAEQKAEVALQTKIEAETKASQLLEVAKIEKEEALTKANMELEVAEIRAQAAEQEKLAMIAQAEGKQKAIELSGEITNLEQAMLDNELRKAEVISDAIAKIMMPSTMNIITAGGMGGEGTQAASPDVLTTHLVNLKLMEATGIIDQANVSSKSVSAKRVTRPASSQ